MSQQALSGTKKDEFSTTLKRWQNQDVLDNYIGDWTREQEAYKITASFQRAGVMAGPTLGPKKLVEYPHL